jgi:hypothetical protein
MQTVKNYSSCFNRLSTQQKLLKSTVLTIKPKILWFPISRTFKWQPMRYRMWLDIDSGVSQPALECLQSKYLVTGSKKIERSRKAVILAFGVVKMWTVSKGRAQANMKEPSHGIYSAWSGIHAKAASISHAAMMDSRPLYKFVSIITSRISITTMSLCPLKNSGHVQRILRSHSSRPQWWLNPSMLHFWQQCHIIIEH